jgi:hypothetical protein
MVSLIDTDVMIDMSRGNAGSKFLDSLSDAAINRRCSGIGRGGTSEIFMLSTCSYQLIA